MLQDSDEIKKCLNPIIVLFDLENFQIDCTITEEYLLAIQHLNLNL